MNKKVLYMMNKYSFIRVFLDERIIIMYQIIGNKIINDKLLSNCKKL